MSDGSAPDKAAFDRTAGSQRWGEGAPRRARARSLRPLLGLMPYVRRQRTTAVLGVVFLFVAAALNLAITFPARWLVDSGFAAEGLNPGAVGRVVDGDERRAGALVQLLGGQPQRVVGR